MNSSAWATMGASSYLEHVLKPLSMSKRDDAAGELEHGEVVLGLAFPAHQESAVAVVPTVRAFDDPPPRFAVDASHQRLLAATPDVRCDPSKSDRGFDIDIVVAL